MAQLRPRAPVPGGDRCSSGRPCHVAGALRRPYLLSLRCGASEVTNTVGLAPQIQPITYKNVEAVHGVTGWTDDLSRLRCQQGHLAQPARREVELGLPGLLRRFPDRRSHTGGTGPTLVAPSRLACTDPTQGCR